LIRVSEQDHEAICTHEMLMAALLMLRQIDTFGHIQPETDRKIRQARIMLKEALKEIRISIEMEDKSKKEPP